LMTAVEFPQADGPPQLATESFTVPPFTLDFRTYGSLITEGRSGRAG